jgi:hypothetical protein
LGDLPFDGDGPLTLKIEDETTVSFSKAPEGDDLLLALAWGVMPYDRVTMTKALEACAFEKALDRPFQAGLSGDKVVLMARIRPGELSAPFVESLILRLYKIREELSRS